jgi:DNA-repair protein complementing XP-A cells
LKAKALRDHREAELRKSGAATTPNAVSGFVATEDVHIPAEATRKRPYNAISKDAVPSSNRDGTNRGSADGALRPAKNFAKYVDYNMSAITDTKGGFLTADDDPHGDLSLQAQNKPGQEPEQKPKHMSQAEWERMQTLKNLRRQKAGPFEPGISVLDDEVKRKRCRECRGLEIDWVWEEVFKCCVCNACKDKYPEKYSLLTKTECKDDYLLTDRTLAWLFLFRHISLGITDFQSSGVT